MSKKLADYSYYEGDVGTAKMYYEILKKQNVIRGECKRTKKASFRAAATGDSS